MNFSNLAKKTSFEVIKLRQKLKTSKDLQAILLLIFWTFGSRILGFVRSFLVLRMPTIDSEIFNSSFVLSEAITSFFILGSITVAILPQMIKLQENEKVELANELENLDNFDGEVDSDLKSKLKAENSDLNDNLNKNPAEKLNNSKNQKVGNLENGLENSLENELESQNIDLINKKTKTEKINQEDLTTGNLESLNLYPILVENDLRKNTTQNRNQSGEFDEQFDAEFGQKIFDNFENKSKNNHISQNNLESIENFRNQKTKTQALQESPENDIFNGQNSYKNSYFNSGLNQKNEKISRKIIENTEKRFILPELSSDPLDIKKFIKTPKLEKFANNSADNSVDNSSKISQPNLKPNFNVKNKIHKIFSNFKLNKDKSVKKLQNFDSDKKIDKLSIYTNWCLLILGSFILILSLLGIIFIEPILSTFNPSFFAKVQESGKLAQMLLLNQFLLFGPVLFAIKTILGVFLNIKKNYKIYSLEGVLANVGWIVALSILYPIFGLIGAGFGMFLGFGITILLFGFQANQLGLFFKLGNFPELSTLLWQTFGLYWPRLLIFSNTRLAEIIVAATSGNPNDPQITSVAMALNFQGIFIGVVLAIGTVFLPNLTEILVQNGKSPQFWKMLFDYLKINFFLSIIGTIATIIGVPILLFLLSKLPFISAKSVLSDQNAIGLIITLTIVSSFSLVFQSVGEILNRYFIAIQRRWEPVIISIGGNFLAIQIALFFSKTWGSGRAAVGGFVLNTALFCFLSLFFVSQDWQNSKNNNKSQE